MPAHIPRACRLVPKTHNTDGLICMCAYLEAPLWYVLNVCTIMFSMYVTLHGVYCKIANTGIHNPATPQSLLFTSFATYSLDDVIKTVW